MCPRIVLPNPTDFETVKRYAIERELHGGPFGEGTLNPFYQIPAVNNAGTWSGIKRPVVPMMLAGTYPLTSLLEVSSELRHAHALESHAAAEAASAATALGQARGGAAATGGSGIGARARSRVKVSVHWPRSSSAFPKHVPCYHICHNEEDPRADLEPVGGPFGPDPYYASRTGHFHEDVFPSGSFMFNGHSVRNFENEAYGGPFGADPNFEFGRKARSAGLKTYGYPPL
eukprot:g4437.t1